MKVKKIVKEVRKVVCMLLTVVMVCTNTGMTVLAEEESVQAEETTKQISEEKDSDEDVVDAEEMEVSENTLKLVFADTDIAHGTSNNITWVINKDGHLIIEGTGDWELDNNRYPAWYTYAESVKTAEVNVKGTTNATGLFCGCINLTNVDVSNFDTSNVTNMWLMFYDCTNLESIDVSNFDTSNVTNMQLMFGNCSNLKSIDVSNFDTSRVKYTVAMFQNCSSLESIDVSGFDTSSMTNINKMFLRCSSLKSLDVSSFDTSNVEYIFSMFSGCSNLTSLDLSSFDMGNVSEMDSILSNCEALTQIYTPRNVPETTDDKENILPEGTWYDMSGAVYTELPKGLSYSILLTKGAKPTTSTERIAAMKEKTSYNIGDTINTDDLTVRYYGTDGTVKILANADYQTNADQIDMSASGTKTLTITYKGMTTEIKLTVTENKTEMVTISGISIENSIYSKTAVTYSGTASVKLQDGTQDGTDVTNSVILTYTYSGTQADGSTYAATTTAPTNAGSYTLTVAVASDNTKYTGSAKYPFKITKAPLTITAHDMELKIGAELPKAGDYKYDTAGLLEGDKLTTNPTLACNIADTAKAGTYEITVSGADAGMNYEIAYKNGTLTVSGTGDTAAYYTVIFNMSGHGTDITNTGIREGTLLEKPQDPQAEGYTFTGWYKDQGCTIQWNFDKDTVQADTVLYAGWTANSSSDGDDNNDVDDSPYQDNERIDLKSVSAEIAKIKDKVYDGNAYEPIVKVTAKDGKKKITLTEGADYRVIYQNNVNAGEGRVIVKGNGIYKGQIEKTFTINKKPIKKLKVIAGGITDAQTGSDLSTLPIHVYDGAVLLAYNRDYTLSDYTLNQKGTAATVKVNAAADSNYQNTTVAKLTIYGSGAKIVLPENVTLKAESGANEKNAYAYTGKAVKPEVEKVTVEGVELTKKQYKVQYQNNKNAGTAYIIITGKGEYKGKAVVPFTIKAETVASSNDFIIKAIPDKTFNGKLQKPPVSVNINKNGKTKKLSKKDYTVAYKNNFHAGEAVVTVTGKGNYAGLTATAKFTIKPQQIKKASLKGTKGSLTLIYSKRKLKEGTDYKTPVYDVPNKNKVKVTIEGIGDFTGTMTKNVKTQ